MKATEFASLILCMLAVFKLTNAANEDEVKSLPGLNFKLTYRHYSGYLDGLNGNHLHYWFFESQNNTQFDPVVLWLNGGPGCSSVMGALTELGPLRLGSNHSLMPNPYAWNVRNSLLFIESPAGVGFSYNIHENLTSDDDATAANNFAALQSFFRKFPYLKENDFYIAGESYGGVYVPTLSLLVSENKFPVNFKGFAIGNGLLDWLLVANSVYHFAYAHGILDQMMWDQLVESCCQNVTKLRKCNFMNRYQEDAKCHAIIDSVTEKMYKLKLNLYNIYDKCYEKTSLGEEQLWTMKALLRGDIAALYKPNNRTLIPPCVDERDAIEYLNQVEVRKALHIDDQATEWAPCTNLPYQIKYLSMRDHVNQLIHSGLRGLIYNGDIDMKCNFLGDMWFTEELGLNQTSEYVAWMHQGQIGGFSKQFGNLTFTTIRGAGHMVPADRPGPAQHMFYKFLLH